MTPYWNTVACVRSSTNSTKPESCGREPLINGEVFKFSSAVISIWRPAYHLTSLFGGTTVQETEHAVCLLVYHAVALFHTTWTNPFFLICHFRTCEVSVTSGPTGGPACRSSSFFFFFYSIWALYLIDSLFCPNKPHLTFWLAVVLKLQPQLHYLVTHIGGHNAE